MFLRTRLLLISVLFLWGCDSGEPESGASLSSAPPAAPLGEPAPGLAESTLAAWQQGGDWLSEAQRRCATLHEQIQTFLATPEPAQLESARARWHECHNGWHRLDPLLALADSNPGLFGDLGRVRFAIDAHPLQPGYLDSIDGYPYSGIVNDITLAITARTLRDQHGLTDDSDVVLGLHALEFLLWGEQGKRPVEDYTHQIEPRDEQLSDELTEGQLPNNRRRELLRLISQLLQDDLAATRERWLASEDRWYRTYRNLHPASRVALLREALRALLQDTLPTALEAEADSEQVHSRFAGQPLQPVASALKGVGELANIGEPPLKTSLAPGEKTQRWNQGWGPVEQWLDNREHLTPSALAEALLQLGETLNPEMVTPPTLTEASQEQKRPRQ
ncbi:imelysin family protein [Marinimicrobium agarilyticum]|uniref:imelysin family protein n=1 Tax=Marinimicrobium agarilyticum TaxID=306546 RepID=UPI0003FAB094|nr:imelysin family protein [Marinimicrobium agarilyticum]